jgi:hypothetical protein
MLAAFHQNKTRGTTMAVCRICHQYDTEDDLVKYAVRHYAHFRCYLADGRKLHALKVWQIKRFPVRVLRDFEQLNDDLSFKSTEVRRMIAADDAQYKR